jgi:hypothetical protein
MTWGNIQTALRARWPVARQSDTALLLVLDVDGQRQNVIVEIASPGGPPAVIVVAEIAGGRLFPPEKALEYNACAAHGALALAGGLLVIRQLVPLAGLVLDELERAIRSACVEATRLRGLVTRSAMHHEERVAFAHLAD